MNIKYGSYIQKVTFRKFNSCGRIPKKATPGSACYDVYSSRNVRVRSGGTEKIELDIGFQFLKRYVCRVYPRSRMLVLSNFLGDGVINSDYRGNIAIIPTNFAACDVDIKIGDRISQIMLLKPEEVSFEEVSEFTDRTVRGISGFVSINQYFFFFFFQQEQETRLMILVNLIVQAIKKNL